MALPEHLLDKLACPKCHGPLRLDEAHTRLVCEACRLAFRIEDDIPVLLLDEAEPVA